MGPACMMINASCPPPHGVRNMQSSYSDTKASEDRIGQIKRFRSGHFAGAYIAFRHCLEISTDAATSHSIEFGIGARLRWAVRVGEAAHGNERR